jgi:hypothetical protein
LFGFGLLVGEIARLTSNLEAIGGTGLPLFCGHTLWQDPVFASFWR